MLITRELLSLSLSRRSYAACACFSTTATSSGRMGGRQHMTLYHDKIDASRTEYRIVDPSARKVLPPLDSLQFGRTFTDHMLSVDWNSKTGWTTPLISEFSGMSLSPAALVLHYGIECFEGMKAYLDADKKVRLFRPEMNMARMDSSMERLALPPLDQEGLLDCIKQLLAVDKYWIPDVDGYSLYIRPTAIATSPYLGVQASSHAKVFVILSPVGPYYKSGFAPLRLYADSTNVRAWPGGVGNVKLGGNYAPTISVSRDAAKQHGCQQILWLSGEDHQITEVGAMNIMFALKSKHDADVIELITPPLERGDILPGITRDAVLSIAKGWSSGLSGGTEYSQGGDDELDPMLKRVLVHERSISIHEVIEAYREKRLLEVFGCGTATIVAPVSGILYEGEEIVVPSGPDAAGPITAQLFKTIIDIQYGRVPYHPWSTIINEDDLK